VVSPVNLHREHRPSRQNGEILNAVPHRHLTPGDIVGLRRRIGSLVRERNGSRGRALPPVPIEAQAQPSLAQPPLAQPSGPTFWPSPLWPSPLWPPWASRNRRSRPAGWHRRGPPRKSVPA